MLQLDVQDEVAPDGKLWDVQLGTYKSRSNAEGFSEKLESMGVKADLALYAVE